MDAELMTAVTRNLVDEGKLIEAGWISLKLLALPITASEAQLDDMRMAFFAGAQHLFSSIYTIVEVDDTINQARMDKIHAELQEFAAEMALRVADAHRA